MENIADYFLPYLPFFTMENQMLFWQYVSALMFVVMPLATIYLASFAVKRFAIVIRRAFGKDDYTSMPKDYDIKTKN